MLFFAYFEQTFLLKKHKKEILFCSQQIDDIFIVWKSSRTNYFMEIVLDLNQQCKVTWNTERLSMQTNFLNLTISIDEDGFTSTKPFQKKMNLFLYIPAHSARPPGVTKSLVFGLLKTYMFQNAHYTDFIWTAKLLYQRLIDRGHNCEILKQIFTDAADRLNMPERYNHEANQNISNHDTRIFVHIPYHPRDILQICLRQIYKETFENKSLSTTCDAQQFDINQMTVAYSRCQNINNTLCSSTLKDDNNNVQRMHIKIQDKGTTTG